MAFHYLLPGPHSHAFSLLPLISPHLSFNNHHIDPWPAKLSQVCHFEGDVVREELYLFTISLRGYEKCVEEWAGFIL